MSECPDDLRDLDRALRTVRFEARHSLGPEIAGRMRRPDPGLGARSGPPRRWVVWGGLAFVALVAVTVLRTGTHPVTIDRCCYDLDGGGAPDDGVRILADPDARVRRLWVYEDRDGSGGLTSADVVRLERGTVPALHSGGRDPLTTIEHCCDDFDGGGPEDDGLIVIGIPPDRVVMAAIYERRPPARSEPAPAGYPLR